MDLLDLWKPALLVSVKFLVLDTVLITDPTSVLSFGIWVTLGAAPCDLDTFLNLWLNLTSNHPQSAWIQLLGTSLNCGCQPVCESRTQRFGPKLTLGAAPGALMHFLWMLHWILLIVHLNLSEPSILVSATTVCCLDFLLNHWPTSVWIIGPGLTLGVAPTDFVNLSLNLTGNHIDLLFESLRGLAFSESLILWICKTLHFWCQSTFLTLDTFLITDLQVAWPMGSGSLFQDFTQIC